MTFEEKLNAAREEARKEGREEGRKEGREEGRQEGREEGRTEERNAAVVRMINKGLSDEKIRLIFPEMTESDLAALRNNTAE